MNVVEEFKRVWDTDMSRKLRGLSLDAGGHASPEQGVCVMEALAYVTGQEFSYSPVCVSDQITELMVEWNDGLDSKRTRNKLKKLIPLIVGTAPIKVEKSFHENWDGFIETDTHEFTDNKNPDYQKAEAERNNILHEWMDDHARNDSDGYPVEEWYKLGNHQQRHDLIVKLANVAHFNK